MTNPRTAVVASYRGGRFDVCLYTTLLAVVPIGIGAVLADR